MGLEKKGGGGVLFMQVRTRTGLAVLFVNSGQNQNQTRTSRLEASAHILCFLCLCSNGSELILSSVSTAGNTNDRWNLQQSHVTSVSVMNHLVQMVQMVLTLRLLTSPSLSRRLRVTAGVAGCSSKTSFLLRCRDSLSTLCCWTTSPSTQVSPAQV